MPRTTPEKTITFLLSYKEKYFAYACELEESAYVCFVYNKTLSSCVLRNYQSVIVADLLLIGI